MYIFINTCQFILYNRFYIKYINVDDYELC